MGQLGIIKYFKSTGAILLLVSLPLLLTYCTPTETVTETPAQEVVEDETIEPDWFSSRVTSRADSVSFYGYSHSSAADSIEAVELAQEMALVNMRFEIDRFAEEKRVSLSENGGNSTFQSAEFIINLRNTVQDLELTTTELTTEVYRADTNIYHAFTESRIHKKTILERLSDQINSELFGESLLE